MALQNIFHRFSSFTYLNATQFTGALNDNIYKLLVVYWLIGLEGTDASSRILSLTGAIFVLPFLLISAASGTLADRVSKRNVIVAMKIFELIIMGLAVAAFAFGSKFGSYALLLLLATQSAIFSPSKYGIIPEIVQTEKISQANGLLTSFTFLAIIFGTFFASFITDITGRNFIIASIFCTFIALFGLLMSFYIEYTPPAGSSKKWQLFFLREIFQTLRHSLAVPSLLAAIIGSAFFLFLGSFVQLNIIPFAVHNLNLTDVQGGYLFLLTAVGIGSGSMLAGRISGKTVELGLVPFGGLGVVISCYMLDFFSHSLLLVIPFVITCGLFGGLYQVPLDSFIQVASPSQQRGQIIAATNFLSFFGVLLASGFLYLISVVLDLEPDTGFALMGTMTLFVTMGLIYQFFDYVTRFVGMLLSKMHFSTTIKGREHIPEQPAIYICHHTALNDTLLLLGAQPRRMRFFLKEDGPKHTSRWIYHMYGLLRFIFIPDILPYEKNAQAVEEIRKMIRNGISVCIFVDQPAVQEIAEKVLMSENFAVLQKEQKIPIVPVAIEKGEKQETPRTVQKIRKRLRVPALLSFFPALQ